VERSFVVAAYDDGARVGFAYVHELPRLDGGRQYFVYEVDVVESHRRRGVAAALLRRVAELARERGVREGFVLTEPDNAPASALYSSVGGTPVEQVLWDFAYSSER
jgi:aminoglycoside 3-N-acetyltransferase I